MEVLMDDHGAAHTGVLSTEVQRDRRRNPSVARSGSCTDRRLTPDRRAGKSGRRAGEGLQARGRERRGCASVTVGMGAGARPGASAGPREPGHEPRNRERKAVGAPGYISRAELCRRLGISRATSYRLERDGFLPRPVRIGSRTTRWPVSELEVFERRLAEDRGTASGHVSEAKSAFAD